MKVDGGLFSDLDQQLIVAAQDESNKIDSAVLNKPHDLIIKCRSKDRA
jgi:hypothetical protein